MTDATGLNAERQVVLDDGQTLELPPDAGPLQELVTLAAQTKTYLWFATEAPSKAIRDVTVPVDGMVTAITKVESGVEVELAPSELVRTLREDVPDFKELLGRLSRSLEERRSVLIAETDRHEIVAVSEPFEAEAGVAPEGGPKGFLQPAAALAFETVVQLFEAIRRHDCGPRPSGSNCIPFMYPDDGCWGRAHQTGHLLRQQGHRGSKIWCYGGLSVPTRNNPNCRVGWRYHVAISLPVDQREDHALDPSMFVRPVPVNEWIAVQSDPTAQLARTDDAVFYRPPSGSGLQYDPDMRQTRSVLNIYRAKLLERAIKVGPAPYAHCRG